MFRGARVSVWPGTRSRTGRPAEAGPETKSATRGQVCQVNPLAASQVCRRSLVLGRAQEKAVVQVHWIERKSLTLPCLVVGSCVPNARLPMRCNGAKSGWDTKRVAAGVADIRNRHPWQRGKPDSDRVASIEARAIRLQGSEFMAALRPLVSDRQGYERFRLSR